MFLWHFNLYSCAVLFGILALFYSAFLRYLVGVFYETSASRTDMSVLLVIENEFDNFDNFLYFLMQRSSGFRNARI